MRGVEAIADAAQDAEPDVDGNGTIAVARGGEEALEVDLLVSAVGQLSRPFVPELPGIDSFAGPAFHSAQWDHGIDLAGTSVAVVGTAATGGLAFTSTDPAAVWVAVGFAVVFVGAVLLTLLLKRTQSLNLCYQLAVLGASAMVIAVHVTLPDPIGVWTGLLHRLLDSMAAAGLRLEGDQNAIVALWAKTMWGALATFALLIAFTAALIAGCVVMARGLKVAERRARQHMHLQAWQLRQLVGG